MTTPLTAALDQIASDWAALTPPTDPTIAYHRIDDEEGPLGGSDDRGFTFEITGSETLGEGADGNSSQKIWDVSGLLLLGGERMGREDSEEAIANESNLLDRSIDRRAAWPTNVIEVQTEGLGGVERLESGDIALTMNFQVYTGETD